MSMKDTIEALFSSYYYNRSVYHMIDLCAEIEERLHGNCKAECTDDGDVIYGFLVCLYGDYGTSPRNGWIFAEYKKHIMSCINYIMIDYNKEVKENV